MFLALSQKLDRLGELLQSHDSKATNAFLELDKGSEEVLKKLTAIRKEAVKSEEQFTALYQSVADITTVGELKVQTQYWALQMSDVGYRVGYEVDAIRSTLQKMRTFVSEKNTMIAFLLESIEDIRMLYERLPAKPQMVSAEVQTDMMESSIDVSHNYKVLLFNYVFRSISLILDSFSMSISSHLH